MHLKWITLDQNTVSRQFYNTFDVSFGHIFPISYTILQVVYYHNKDNSDTI